MNIRVQIFDNRHGNIFDVSQAIGNMKISTHMDDTPGKCEFEIIKINELAFWEGAVVTVVLDGVNMFKGYVFKKQRDKYVDIIKVTAYDQMRYLKNKDFRVFRGVTSSQIFAQLCKEFVLSYQVTHPSDYICAPRNETDTSLYDMIKHALDDTFVNTRNWYFIRDDFGVLKHLNIAGCYSGYMLGDTSGVTDFDYETSIDEDVYNQIKLYRDNEETGKRDTYVVNDTINGGQTIKEWGILQLYEKIDEKYNIAQIEARGLSMLNYYNSTRRSLKLSCLGIPTMFAGSSIKCSIKDLGDLSLDSYMLITDCTHTINNGEHTMELTTEVVRPNVGWIQTS